MDAHSRRLVVKSELVRFLTWCGRSSLSPPTGCTLSTASANLRAAVSKSTCARGSGFRTWGLGLEWVPCRRAPVLGGRGVEILRDCLGFRHAAATRWHRQTASGAPRQGAPNSQAKIMGDWRLVVWTLFQASV